MGRIVAMAIGLAVVLLLAAAGEARGGLYKVAQCGWGVGADLDPGYPATEGTSFSLNTTACAPPPGLIATGMRFEAGVAPDGTFGLARARWTAPGGTSFRAAHLTWSGNLQRENWEALGVDVGDQFRLLVGNTESKPPTPVDLAIDGEAWAFEAWLRCIYTGSFIPCTRSTASTMVLSDLTFTLEDHRPPQVQLGGPLVAPGWRRGPSVLELLATDVGAGIAAGSASIDGSTVIDVAPTCAAQVVEGELRATKMTPCPTSATGRAEVDTTGLADGNHAVRACATDFSGAQACAAETPIAIDNSPPSVSFAAAAEGEVAAAVSDRFSGAGSGAISLRRADADVWTDLPTTFDGEGDSVATLTADLPDLPTGTYLLRATAADVAGNLAVAQLRLAGTPVELRRQAAEGHGEKGTSDRGVGPARRRRHTHLTSHLGRHGGSSLTLDYGSSINVRGRLTEAQGDGIAHKLIFIAIRPAAGVGGTQRRRVVTHAHGRFALRLPPGTSRHVTVAFHGGRGLAPARRSLTLRVRASITLTAAPTDLRTGDAVHLSGRVRLGPAHVSGRGKLVAIQYLERATGRWRPALVVRTDAAGHFATSYRFRYVTGLARIRLRATAPAEGGWPFARGSSPPLTVTVNGRPLVAARGR